MSDRITAEASLDAIEDAERASLRFENDLAEEEILISTGLAGLVAVAIAYRFEPPVMPALLLWVAVASLVHASMWWRRREARIPITNMRWLNWKFNLTFSTLFIRLPLWTGVTTVFSTALQTAFVVPHRGPSLAYLSGYLIVIVCLVVSTLNRTRLSPTAFIFAAAVACASYLWVPLQFRDLSAAIGMNAVVLFFGLSARFARRRGYAFP
jgi:hypothetical protein